MMCDIIVNSIPNVDANFYCFIDFYKDIQEPSLFYEDNAIISIKLMTLLRRNGCHSSGQDMLQMFDRKREGTPSLCI